MPSLVGVDYEALAECTHLRDTLDYGARFCEASHIDSPRVHLYDPVAQPGGGSDTWCDPFADYNPFVYMDEGNEDLSPASAENSATMSSGGESEGACTYQSSNGIPEADLVLDAHGMPCFLRRTFAVMECCAAPPPRLPPESVGTDDYEQRRRELSDAVRAADARIVNEHTDRVAFLRQCDEILSSPVYHNAKRVLAQWHTTYMANAGNTMYVIGGRNRDDALRPPCRVSCTNAESTGFSLGRRRRGTPAQPGHRRAMKNGLGLPTIAVCDRCHGHRTVGFMRLPCPKCRPP